MKNQIKIMCATVVLAMAGQVSADTTWTLNTGSVAGSNSTVTATSSGWANTGTGGSINTRLLESQPALTNLQLYSGGLGINNLDGCSSGSGCDVGDISGNLGIPEHAIDNNQRNEMVLLSFDKSVNLTNVKFGWTNTIDNGGTSRTEYTVMAYAGTGMPGLTTKTWGGATGLLANGWVTIGNYADATTAANNRINNSISNSQYSSHWLVGAYNPLAGGAASGFSSRNDYLKLASVSGTIQSTGKVPEPGSLALFGTALLGMLTLCKRHQA